MSGSARGSRVLRGQPKGMHKLDALTLQHTMRWRRRKSYANSEIKNDEPRSNRRDRTNCALVDLIVEFNADGAGSAGVQSRLHRDDRLDICEPQSKRSKERRAVGAFG